MMFVCWWALGLCGTFVPFVQHDSILFFKMNLTSLLTVVEQGARVGVFVPDQGSRLSVTTRKNLMNAIPIFSNQLVFVEISEQDARPLFENAPTVSTRLLGYVNGTLYWHCKPPFSEMALLRLLNLLAVGPSAPVTSRQELYEALGQSYFSLVYPASDAVLASNVQRFASISAGFIDLIPFAKQHASEIGIKEDSFYLFRLEDLALVEVQKNETDVLQNLRGLFVSLSEWDVTKTPGLVFAVTVNQLTINITSVLEAVATKHPSVKVGFATRALVDIVNISVAGTVKSTPGIAFFNPVERTYYPVPKELNQVLKTGEGIEKVLEFLEHVEEPIALSEPVPTEQPNCYTKLVGTTFSDFVNQSGVDAIVLFLAGGSKMVQQILREFDSVAKLFRDKGIANVKFGIINVTVNSGQFPYMPLMPHFEIYPAANKSDHRTCFLGGYDNIIRCAKRYATTKFTIDVPDAPNNDLFSELVQIYAAMDGMCDSDRSKARERLEEIAPILKLNLTDIDSYMRNELGVKV